MTVKINIPHDVEETLRAAWGDLDRAATEALIIESYRTGKLSIGEVARLLGVPTRFDAEQWLGRRGVNWNYSLEDLEADRETLARLSGGTT